MASYSLPSAPDTQPGPSSRPIQARPHILSVPQNTNAPYIAPAPPPGAYHAAYMTKVAASGIEDYESASRALGAENTADDGKKKKTKRRKVNHACLYCRRSHMTCDEGRPCQRCIKREIGHLCHDEPRAPGRPNEKSVTPSATSTPGAGPSVSRTGLAPYNASTPIPIAPAPTSTLTSAPPPVAPWPTVTQGALLYPAETLRSEFSVLTDFLDTLDERAFYGAQGAPINPQLAAFPRRSTSGTPGSGSGGGSASAEGSAVSSDGMAAGHTGVTPKVEEYESTSDAAMASPRAVNGEDDAVPPENLLPSATKAERFLLTAADQSSGSRVERLNRVIRSKYEAGLLKPYDYVRGYARLSRWMDRNVSQESKQAILQPLSILRPKFRAVAQSLTDLDHVFIEEAFERLLLDYDRVFSAMGIPACLWRRTGEIYKGNREFAELVGVDGSMLRDGRLCIYELMAEESAVNYWEKYGHVAFDSTQKAVLTSCVLRHRPNLTGGPPPAPTVSEFAARNEDALISCCFSITIRRDTWGIPSLIVGNFIKC